MNDLTKTVWIFIELTFKHLYCTTWLFSGMYVTLDNSEASCLINHSEDGSIKMECPNSLPDGGDTEYLETVTLRYTLEKEQE